MIIGFIIAKLALFLVGRGIGGTLAKILAPIIIYGGIGLAIWFGGPWLWNTFIAEPYREEGRVEIRAEWKAAVIAEEARIAKAVAEAQAEAQKTIDALEKKESELNAKLEQALADDANKPDSGGGGIGADSVQFLNGIR